MAHFDHRGEVAPHARRQAAALAEAVDELIIVSTADLNLRSRRTLSDLGRLVERRNLGYDFYSYRTGLELAHPLSDFDEVVICNDSYVGPLRPYERVFAEMHPHSVDFWGLTGSDRIAPHLQSFFLVFRPWVVQSRAFTAFWQGMTPLSDRKQVIHRYEVGMTQQLTEAGFRWESYFRQSANDKRSAQRRMAWWHAHRYDHPRWSSQLNTWTGQSDESWNPSLALADRALDDGRLPMVKIDTLRYDPMRLNAARLLELGEQQAANWFDGVRRYLDDTADLYPVRHLQTRPDTPLALRPLRPLVEYRDAR